MENNGRVTTFRFDPAADKEPRYERYEIPYEYWHRVKVIDTLRCVYEALDPRLSFREPCRQQMCGACILLVNKKSVLACQVFSEQEMTIEPVSGRAILKDLITESSRG